MDCLNILPNNHKHNYQILSSIALDKVDIYLRDGPFSSYIGIANLHESGRTHWVVYIIQNYFDSYGFAAPQKVTKCIIKRNGLCSCSEYKIQGLTSKRVLIVQVIVYI